MKFVKGLVGACLLLSPLAAQGLSFEGVRDLEVLEVPCSFTTIWEELGSEGLEYGSRAHLDFSYFSIKKNTLLETFKPFTNSYADVTMMSEWIDSQSSSKLRMRGKTVFGQLEGGEWVDEHIMFCSKNEDKIYKMSRLVWGD